MSRGLRWHPAFRRVGATAVACLLAAAAGAGAPDPEALAAEIARADAEFFAAQFDRCDPERLGALVTDDFEFYHDRWGRIAASRDAFVAGMRERCRRQAEGLDYRARRELVPETFEVEPLGDYGAVALGTHRFYRRDPGKPEVLVETARFAIVWKREGDQWRMARALSFTHRKLGVTPP